MGSICWADLGRGATCARRNRFARAVIAAVLLAGAAAGDDSRSSPSSAWAPPDIDHVFAPLSTETPCPLGEVVAGASQRVQDLVGDMQRFSATEEVDFDEVDNKGVLRPSKKAAFSYVAYIHQEAPRQLVVEEYRDDTVAVKKFPSKLATIGTAAFALIFHPVYLKDYAVSCEGLSEWRGRRAWRLHLTQVQANNFRYYRIANRSFGVMLKARAWIDAETLQILRLETDLRDPIPEIQLRLEHVIVEYALVEFPSREVRLWLPREAEIYMDCRGHQYRHRHSFSHFRLFWVDTEQTVKTPRMSAAEPSYPPGNIAEKPLQPNGAREDKATAVPETAPPGTDE